MNDLKKVSKWKEVLRETLALMLRFQWHIDTVSVWKGEGVRGVMGDRIPI